MPAPSAALGVAPAQPPVSGTEPQQAAPGPTLSSPSWELLQRVPWTQQAHQPQTRGLTNPRPGVSRQAVQGLRSPCAGHPEGHPGGLLLPLPTRPPGLWGWGRQEAAGPGYRAQHAGPSDRPVSPVTPLLRAAGHLTIYIIKSKRKKKK